MRIEKKPMSWQRPDNRQPDQLRPISFERKFTRFAPGSILTKCGGTEVLCTVTVQEGVPKFLEDTGSGWLTAEYRMLPGATPGRQKRHELHVVFAVVEISRSFSVSRSEKRHK